MDAGPGMSFLLMQLLYQAPTLLVCLVAGILAIVYMNRAMLVRGSLWRRSMPVVVGAIIV